MRAGSSCFPVLSHSSCPALCRASASSLFLRSETWMAGTSSAKTRFALLPGHDAPYCSHRHLANGQRSGFRRDPLVEQIEIDVAAAQDQADPPAADFCLVLQGGGERRGAGAFRKIMGVGPVGAYRD